MVKYYYKTKGNRELTFDDVLLTHPCHDEFTNALNLLGKHFVLNSKNVQHLMDVWEKTRPAWFAYLVNKGLVVVKS